PQLLRRRERAVRTTRHALHGAAARPPSTLTLHALRGRFLLFNRHRFRHVLRSSLRPSAHAFPGGTVSRDIGTGGCGDAFPVTLARSSPTVLATDGTNVYWS